MELGFFDKLKYCLKKEEGMKTTMVGRIFRMGYITALGISAGLIALFVYGAFESFQSNYETQTQNYAEIYAGTISQWTSLIREQIETQADNDEFTDESISLEKRKELLNEAADKSEFKDFSISYSDGTTYNDTDISERDYFQKAMEGQTYISSPVVRKTDGKLTIMVGSKLNNNKGIIYGGIDADFFSSLISNVKISDSGMAFIVDGDGTVIAYPDEQVVMDQINPIEMSKEDSSYTGWSNFVSKMIDGQSLTEEVEMPDGVEYIVSSYPIEGAEGWSIAVMVKSHAVAMEVADLTNICVWIILAVLVIEFFFILFIASNIAYPIKKATNSIERLAEGNLSTDGSKILERKDETEILMRKVEKTRSELAEYIGEISDVLTNISKGNLNLEITKKYTGDFVAIKNSLNTILDSLNLTMGEVSNASANLLEGARQVEQASQALASASTQQASSVVEITASIDGISKNVAGNTEDVIKVNELTQTAKKEADTGSSQMIKMLDAMTDISNSSHSIAKIMKVIDDISFQTNILALNASVEAARAGVHGKGFAVVAEEVRTLASKSSSAASEISEMIDDTINKINNGAVIAKDTSEELKKIVDNIEEIAGVMVHIADMSKDQAQAIGQVDIGLEQISAVVQNNSATSQQCAASAVELSSQADGLMNQVRNYRLRY